MLKKSISFSPKFYIMLLFAALILVSSCKGDKKQSLDDILSEEDIDLNFTINGKLKPGMDRIGKDISDQEYNDDPMNEDFVMHVTIGDSIYFQDKSKISENLAVNRQWFINAQPLESRAAEVGWYSDIPSNVIVTLRFGDDFTVQKGLVLKEDLNSFEGFLEETEQAEVAVAEDKPEQPSRTNTNTSNQTSKPTTTAKKPEPVAISNVDFSMDRQSAEAGQGIVFRDQSTPASAVNVRVWDFGDGNNMTTRGATVQHVYAKEGNYTVKMCLNYSAQCERKQVSIRPSTNVLAAKPKEEDKPANKPAAPEISKVFFSLASTGSVGKPINIEDTSIPEEAVTSRKWYVNGTDINLDRKKLSRTFDKAGKYEVRLCVNGSQKDCYSSVISIEEDKPAIVSNTSSSSAEAEFLCMDTQRCGVRSSQLCTSDNKKYISTSTKLTLVPNMTLELRNATIYGKNIGYVDIVLKSADGKINKKLNKAQVLPGRSIIELGELATTLKKGVSYTLEIVMPADGSLEIEDAGTCNTNFAKVEEMTVTYEGSSMALMDIKFCH